MRANLSITARLRGAGTSTPTMNYCLANLRQNGNVLSTGGKSFTYDSENHMTSMTASGTAASMTYDGFGNRASCPIRPCIRSMPGREAYS